MGIDQSVLLLRKGNDLDKSQVFNELDEFSRKQMLPQRYYGIEEWADFSVSKSWTSTKKLEIKFKYFALFHSLELWNNFINKCSTS